MDKVKIYYPYMDGLKGLAILLMVMAHVLAWSYPDPRFLSAEKLCEMTTSEFNAAFLWKLIYSFHMPLLFVVSGFLFYKNIVYNIQTAWNIVKKRITRILVPYLFTGVFVLFLKGYYGYWFLQVLFFVNIIVVFEYFILNKIKSSKVIGIISHIVIFLLLYAFGKLFEPNSLPKEFCNIVSLSEYYLAFMCGYLLRQFPSLLNNMSKQSVGLICFMVYGILFSLENSSFSIPHINLAIPIFASIFLVQTFQNIDYQSITGGGKVLAYIGRNSLEIYIFHLFFVIPFKEVGNYIFVQENFAFSVTVQIVYSLAISIIAISLSVTVSKFLKLNKYLSKLFFGN